MNNTFIGEQNIEMIWNILQENFRDKMDNIIFKEQFQTLKRQISTKQNKFKNLIEMNKHFLMECSKILQTTNTRLSAFENTLRNKEDEFNKMMEKKVPKTIDFECTPSDEFDTNVGELYSQQMTGRQKDLDSITKKYNIKKAEDWINNEVPPPLAIDHNTPRAVETITTVKRDPPRVPKRVSFRTPLENNTFLDKLKKGGNKKLSKQDLKPSIRQNVYMNGDKIQDNKIIFFHTMEDIKKLTLTKLLMPNITKQFTNVLGQIYTQRLGDEPILLYKICINDSIEKKNLLLVKKSDNDKVILYETDETIEINDSVNSIEISLFTRDNIPYTIPSFIEIQYFLRASQLTINNQDNNNFSKDIYCYLIFKDSIFFPGEKVKVKDKEVPILGTCRITVGQGKSVLEDVDPLNWRKHNCSIIEWSGEDIRIIRDKHRIPRLYLQLISK